MQEPKPKRFQFSLLTALMLLLGAACIGFYLYSQYRIIIPEELARMEFANAQTDFDADQHSGNTYFKGVHGIGLSVPGVDDFREKYPHIKVVVIRGTSDVSVGDHHARLQQKAREYAYQYNLLVVKTLESLKDHPYDTALPLEMQRLEFADPQVDVDAAFAQKNYRFKGYAAYDLVVPLNGANIEHWQFGVDFIVGTSDALLSARHAELQEKAMKYAEKYNALMNQKLKDAKIIP